MNARLRVALWYLALRWHAWRLGYCSLFESSSTIRCFEDYRAEGYSPRGAVLEDLSYL